MIGGTEGTWPQPEYAERRGITRGHVSVSPHCQSIRHVARVRPRADSRPHSKAVNQWSGENREPTFRRPSLLNQAPRLIILAGNLACCCFRLPL